MTKQKYILLVALFTGIGNFNIHAETNNQSTQASIKNDELIKTLPTALLENLKRDLQTQEEKENKSIESIAGISKKRLEAEIASRNAEDRSKTLGTRTINTKLLPSDLLKYIAEHGVSYEGCNPQDAMNEIQNRLGVAEDLPSVLVSTMQEQHAKEVQKKTAEEFANRENAEDLSATLEDMQENVEKGRDPSIAKQAELIKEKEENSKSGTTDALQKAINGDQNIKAPHGYNEKAQNDRTSDEINDAQAEVEKLGIVPDNVNNEPSLWEKTKKAVSDWFNGEKKDDVSQPQTNSGNNTIENDKESAQHLASAITTAVEDAA